MALKFRRPCNDEDVEKLVEIFTRKKKSASTETISESTRKKIYCSLGAVYSDLES